MDDKVKKIIEEYKEYAKENGISLNPDEVFVENLVKRLLENEKKYGHRYCPCRLISGNDEQDKDKICPCVFMRTEIKKQNRCLCGLFFKKNN